MRRTLAALGLIAGVAGGSATAPQAYAAADATGRLLVTFDAHATAARAAAATAGTRRGGPAIPQLRTVTVKPRRSGTSLHALAARLRARRGIGRVEVEHRAQLRYAPNDPALVTQEPSPGAPPNTPIEWWAQRQGLFTAWDVTRGETAKVAVIDVGVEATHPELVGRVDEAVDNDDSGTTQDATGHGTHVASLACGAGDNAIGLVGAGFGCRLLVYKSDLSDGSVARSIVQATDAGAHAINMSFGTEGTAPAAHVLVDALRYARRHDVVLVAAAADQAVQEQGDPANVLQPTGSGADLSSNLGLSVTAANAADQRAAFAGYGSQISLAAYGAFGAPGGPRGLFGAFPAGEVALEQGSFLGGPPQPCQCRTTFGDDSRYAYLQGTSMAAPIVAAVAALVRDVNPDLRAGEVVTLLKQTARRAPGTGWQPNLGWGILDAGAAVVAAQTLDRRAPTSKAIAPTRTHRRTVRVRLTGSDAAPPRCVASGIRRYDVYRSVDGGRPQRVVRTTARTVRVRVQPRRAYTFFSVATDKQGNREHLPKQPDARVRVLP